MQVSSIKIRRCKGISPKNEKRCFISFHYVSKDSLIFRLACENSSDVKSAIPHRRQLFREASAVAANCSEGRESHCLCLHLRDPLNLLELLKELCLRRMA